jgi:hypothetical protein
MPCSVDLVHHFLCAVVRNFFVLESPGKAIFSMLSWQSVQSLLVTCSVYISVTVCHLLKLPICVW